MPIRMTDDGNEDEQSFNDSRGNGGGSFGGGGGGGNLLFQFLPMILGFVFRRPKIGIPILIVLGIFFFSKKSGCSNIQKQKQEASSGRKKGCNMDQSLYDQASVYEPLADNAKNPLPDAVSLLEHAPQRLNQGQQGSCVAWASAYAARTILLSKQTGQDPNQIRFSPSFLYNQIALEDCQGSYIIRAAEKMQDMGLVPFNDFPYDDQSCSREPDGSLKSKATNFKIKGFQRLSMDGDDYKVNMLAIKQNLAQGGPVVIGMQVGGTFMTSMEGKDTWFPTEEDSYKQGFGGHALCVIGYDDNKEGGAFQIMNSWGEVWGDKGIFYLRYRDFQEYVVEAYGLYNMGDADASKSQVFDVKIGFVNNDTKQYISFNQKQDNVFTTSQVLKKGTKFKIEVTNTQECYIYLFGKETDGSNYVLFPYTPKHSPYCGIKGTRLFPKYQSATLDEIGTQDYAAVVVSTEPLDYKQMNDEMNTLKSIPFEQRIKKVVGNKLTTNISYSGGDFINMNAPQKNNILTYAILEVNKQ